MNDFVIFVSKNYNFLTLLEPLQLLFIFSNYYQQIICVSDCQCMSACVYPNEVDRYCDTLNFIGLTVATTRV